MSSLIFNRHFDSQTMKTRTSSKGCLPSIPLWASQLRVRFFKTSFLIDDYLKEFDLFTQESRSSPNESMSVWVKERSDYAGWLLNNGVSVGLLFINEVLEHRHGYLQQDIIERGMTSDRFKSPLEATKHLSIWTVFFSFLSILHLSSRTHLLL